MNIDRRPLLAGLLATPFVARAQGFPTRPIQLIVSGPAGGTTDYTARLIALPLSERLGVPVVVENRPGGNGTVAVMPVVRGRPDGHTLLLAYCANLTGRPAIEPNIGYDPRRDLAPVALLVEAPQVMMVHPSVPANTLAEFIDYAKQRPGVLNYASSGSGSMQHLGTELLKNRTGIDIVHVPYRGTGETMNDVLAGRIQFYMTTPPPALPFVREGKLKALAMASTERHPAMPEVPTVAEAGLTNFSAEAWFSLMSTAGTPAPVVERLTRECAEVLRDEAVKQRVIQAGAFARYEDPQVLAGRIDRELVNWARLVRDQRLSAD
ncbi:Bug family tripartite tricarboxylate transporter substrate binding protein [Roseococcus pinisoli]|uniref:Tripartite tricarboxylate transporter substrate binding protein n=1 Tax=Roseococcus pinisoli TaxID=2835040 RepID=A0ABS5QFL2_9PROT|nr:tripartite tricarboxylate transporter substrate binding protein [Roseococcus pinisoli]MBS7812096.1 tripartite tricarboxylate transporter substrate binding protein [Roseococcus pinisoli]